MENLLSFFLSVLTGHQNVFQNIIGHIIGNIILYLPKDGYNINMDGVVHDDGFTWPP